MLTFASAGLARSGSGSGGEGEPLRVSYSLSIDAIPLKFGIDQGIFRSYGLEMVGEFMRSPKERRYALASGDLDCIIGDISTAIFGVANAQQTIAITSTAFERIDGGRQLALLGSGRNYMGVETLEELLDRLDSSWQNSIGVVRYTDVEFATDMLFERLGHQVDERQWYQEALDHVTVYQLLIFGKILAGVLPEPLATLASERNSIPNGGTLREGDWAFVLSEYEGVSIMPSVIVFRRELLSEGTRVERFYQAYGEAVDQLNALPREERLQLGVEMGLAAFRELYPVQGWQPPEGFAEIFEVVEFPQPRALSEEEFEAVARWAERKGYIKGGSPPAYAEVVDTSFVA